MEEKSEKNYHIAVDVAQSVLGIAVSFRSGRIATRYGLQHSEVMPFFAANRRRPCSSSMGLDELLGPGAQEPRAQRRPAPPQHVPCYSMRNRVDRADTMALPEALRTEEIPTVPMKAPAQLALAALQRLCSAWVGTRTGSTRLAVCCGGAAHSGRLATCHPANPRSGRRVRVALPASLLFVLIAVCAEVRELDGRLR